MLTFNMPDIKIGEPTTGGLKPPNLDINIDKFTDAVKNIPFVSELIKGIEKYVPFGGVIADVVADIAALLDGCPDSFDENQIKTEETVKAGHEISQSLSYMNDKSLPTVEARLTRADRYLRFAVHHHWYRGEKVNCGHNKYAEAVKYHILNEYMWKLRNDLAKVFNYREVTESYNEPTLAPEGTPHRVTYRAYSLKPDSDTKAKELIEKSGVNTTTTGTNTNTTTNTGTTTSNTGGSIDTPQTEYFPNWLIAIVPIVLMGVYKGAQYIYKKFKPKRKKSK